MEVRLLKPIGYRKVGSKITVGDGVAELWILQRKAERVSPSQPEAMVPAKPSRGTGNRPKRARSRDTSERHALS
jgi:hypothetical protein